MPNKQSKQIAIAVLGCTGSGKSSFINTVMGPRTPGAHIAIDRPKIGHNLKSCTAEITPVPLAIGGLDVILIDTPGYDDTSRSDVEILRLTADFFELSLRQNHPLTGIIYLHRISDNRVGGVAAKNFRMLSKICGAEAMRNVILCTTMWDALDDVSTGEEREKELCDAFWRPMIAAGATVMRYNGSEDSALAIVSSLMKKQTIILQLQDELINRGMKLSETAAGKEVGEHLAREMEAHKEEIEHLRHEISTARAGDMRAIQDDMAKERDLLRMRELELDLLMRSRDQEIQELSRRVEEQAGGGFWDFVKDLIPHALQLIPQILSIRVGGRHRPRSHPRMPSLD